MVDADFFEAIMPAMVEEGTNDPTGSVQNLDRPSRLGGMDYGLITKAEYRAAHKFLAEEGFPRTVLGFPTVVAKKDGTIVGLLSTVVKDNMIIAGPLAIRTDRPRVFTLIRLVEAYETVMRRVGVTRYIFHTDQPPLIEQVKKLGMVPYAEENGMTFFLRKLDEQPNG